MESSFQNIKNILDNNKLISGRLKQTSQQIHSIFRKNKKQNQKIQNELDKQNKILCSCQNKIKDLKLKLKKSDETLQKAFFPTIENISLLYKKVGTKYYIKGRFYWHGKQCEVQVGSIENIIKTIKRMIQNGYLNNYNLPKFKNITWENLKKNHSLIIGAKKIASLKFQEYMIRKLSDNEIVKNEKIEKETTKVEEHVEISSFDSKSLYKNKKYNWYEKWGRENL